MTFITNHPNALTHTDTHRGDSLTRVWGKGVLISKTRTSVKLKVVGFLRVTQVCEITVSP